MVTQAQFVSTNAFSATVLDLARKKYIKIEAIPHVSTGFLGIGGGTSYKYTLHKDNKNYPSKKKLLPFENEVLEFLFSEPSDGEKIEMDELKKYMKAHPTSTRAFFTKWKKMVTDEAKNRGFVDKVSSSWRTKFVVSNVILLVLLAAGVALYFHVFASAFYEIIWGAVFSGIILTAFARVFLKWSNASQKEAYEWLGFKRFLSDFSRFKSEIPQAVIIWEERLGVS